MKEKIYTAPLTEAFASGDECPFCALEREAEQRTIRFALGPSASYMEPEVRGETNRLGFCTAHCKKVFDYGNALGSALILQTYFETVLEDFGPALEGAEKPAKKTLFAKPKQDEPLWKKIEDRLSSCFLCDRVEYHMQRYYHNFFLMVKEEEEFRRKVEKSKGFCLHHFAQLLRLAEEKLSNSQREWFYEAVFPLMRENLDRVKEDLDWLVAKYDYRNASADWKNSKDALQRTIQKLQSGYVADPPYSQR